MKVKHLLIALLTSAATVFSATAQESDGQLDITQGIYNGFIGTPMLKSLGYKAESGAFQLTVGGEGSIQNPSNITDNDPDNYASCTNLADLAVGADSRVRLLVDRDYCNANGIMPKTLGPGTEVGFVFSSEAAGVSVLDANVLKMFVIYFYKGSELVATKNASTNELDILGVNLVSIGGNKQKVTAVAPDTDKDGNTLKFDGIGFGFASVDVGVGKQVRLHYGFIDDFEMVPIIRKYFKNASSKVSGMVTGGNNLTNNNLSDGATTAVLNVGGAYYTVLANEKEPFPAGVEAGFVMTAGSVLDLNLGKAVQIAALTYPMNGDGTYDFNADPIEIDVTTDINAVGLQLIGGGKTKVTLVTKHPCFGFKLNRIAVANLDLGATVVHYAYVKLPEMPKIDYPFEAGMTVVPNYSFTESKSGLLSKASTSVTNRIYLRNVAERPIKTPAEMPNIWRTYGSDKYISLTLTRKRATQSNNTEAEVVGYVEITQNNPLIGSTTYTYKYKKASVLGSTVESGKLPTPGADGIIDISNIIFNEDAHTETLATGDTTADAAKSFEYTLYFADPKDDADNIENALELAYDEVAVPAIWPEYEMAGTTTYDEIYDADDTDNPSDVMKPGAYGRYVKITVPDAIDYKTDVKSLDIYKYTSNYKSEKVATYTLNDSQWTSADGTACPQISQNGVSQILYHETEADKDCYYAVVCHTELNPEYAASEKVTTENLDYGCTMTKAAEYKAPVLTSHIGQDFKRMVVWLRLTFNDADASHSEQYGDILYNQWATFQGNARANNSYIRRTTAFNEDDYKEFSRYYDNGMHKATTYARIEETDDVKFPMTYSAYSRSYIPVRPAGYGENATTYLVADNTSASMNLQNDTTTGVENVSDSNDDSEAVYYNLQGIRIDNPTNGVYIRRQGNKTEKVIL